MQPPSEPEPGAQDACDRSSRDDPGVDLPIWDLYIDLEVWEVLHQDVEEEIGVRAALCIDGQQYPITLELQGSSTRRQKKKSFDVKFNHGSWPARPPFDGAGDSEGLERVLLKAVHADHSLIREPLAFDMWRAMGYEAPRTGFANLRVNGAYWGLYLVVEPVNRAYLRHHGYAAGGRLYKAVRKHGTRADFHPGRDVRKAYEYKTETLPNAYEDLEALISTLQNTLLTQDAFEREIDPIFPLGEYMDRMIWVALTQNSDAVSQNYYLYHVLDEQTGRWYLIPWDSNLAFGADWSDADAVLPADQMPLVDGRNHFGQRLVRVDGLREDYVERFRDVVSDVLTIEHNEALRKGYAELVNHDLELDRKRWERPIRPEEAHAVIRDFIAERPAHLEAALEELLAGE